MTASGIFGVFKDAGSAWLADRAPSAGASLAWYTVFSLAPLLLIVITITGWAIGEDAAREYLDAQMAELFGTQGATTVRSMMDAARRPGTGLVAQITGWAMLLFGTVGLLVELQDALNAVWKVRPPADRGILGTLRARLLTFSVVLAVASLLLVSLVVSAVINTLARFGGTWVDQTTIGLLTNAAVSFGVITALFALIFRLVPEARVAWADVWLGAAVTAALFMVGRSLIGWYLGVAAVASAFGAAGSLAALLVWLYYSAQIFLYGAEFTRVFAERYGSRVAARHRHAPAVMPGRMAPS